MKILNWLYKKKTKKEGSYGKAVVLLSSDPAEIERICDKLGEDYREVMEVTELENGDYSKVIIRREAEK